MRNGVWIGTRSRAIRSWNSLDEGDEPAAGFGGGGDGSRCELHQVSEAVESAPIASLGGGHEVAELFIGRRREGIRSRDELPQLVDDAGIVFDVRRLFLAEEIREALDQSLDVVRERFHVVQSVAVTDASN